MDNNTIRANIARIIKTKEFTQETIADRMTALGCPWTRRTVYRTTVKRDRDVRAHELAPLALSLGVVISDLLIDKDGYRAAGLEPLGTSRQKGLICPAGSFVVDTTRMTWWYDEPTGWGSAFSIILQQVQEAATAGGWEDVDEFNAAFPEVQELPLSAAVTFIAQHPKGNQ